MKNKTRWDALSMRDRASLIRLYTQNGVLNLKQMKKHYNSFETGGDKVNYRIKGQDWSTWTPSQVQEAINWGVAYPEQFFGEEGAELRDRLSRAGMADSVIGSIYSMAPREIQEAVGDRYKSTAQRESEYASGITSAIDNAGKDIYNIADTVTGFMPGPIGGINWGAHMATDALTGNWGKVAGDVAMAGLMGLGAAAVSKAANKVRKSLDIGKIDLNVEGISGKLYNIAPSAELVRRPFEIESLGGGYMLKSLMRGNPLEKQISKQGTVNVGNIRALINKSSKVEQAVVDKVLASEEFTGKRAIDYNKFRKAIQDELITYERTQDTRWNNYGIEGLGLSSYNDAAESPEMIDSFNEFVRNNFAYDPDSDRFFMPGDPSSKPFDSADLAKMFFEDGPGFSYIPVGVTKELNTFTFSSPRIPNGSAKHYSPNTLGHSRTYTTTDEPDVLHVMESQSDWAQRKAPTIESAPMISRGVNGNTDIIYDGTSGKYRRVAVGEGIPEDEFFHDIGSDGLTHYSRFVTQSKKEFPLEQADYLKDNYTSRQIQENLRYAAEKGQTKMRYPTRETAAKIEGYPAREAYFDAQGKDITNSGQSIYTFGEKLDKELKDINDKLVKLQEYDYRWDVRDKMAELFERKNNILKGESQLRPGITKKTVYDYEDILKKYTKFPEQYRKLYKDAEVRTVSDRMGNTWYEVDVPKDYLNQEWAYANGGPLVNMFYTGGDKDTMKNLAYKIGAYVHDGAGATHFGLLKAVTSPQQDYDELKAYLWGPENVGFEPYTGTSTKPYLGTNIPTYNATINPNGQYVFPENMRGFIEEIANRNGNIYLNADLMPGSDKPRYDAANYPVNLFYDNNGNIAGNAADLYDFGINYSNHYSKTPKWQIKAMRKQGVPYAVRQDNIPFVFSNSPEAENTVTALSYGEMGNKNESDEAIINAMSRLGNGTIEPASITFEYPERLENYASGGKIHIKPENRGKFTALKKRTGKTASWFKAHGTPAQKKMATFALNAAKWHKK